MNLIRETIKKIKTLIWKLDEDKFLNKDEIDKAKSELRRYFNKRTSPLLFRVRYVKDRLSNSSKDQKIGAKIDAIGPRVLRQISRAASTPPLAQASSIRLRSLFVFTFARFK